MSQYTHLTIFEREEIAKLHAQGYTIREIARQLRRNPSTISREMNRNAFSSNQYSPTIAHRLYKLKRKNCGRKKILSNFYLKNIVKHLFLDEQWSPEEIANRLELEDYPIKISYSTIYRAIYAFEFDDEMPKQGHRGVVKKLRRKGKKYKCQNHNETRGKIVISHTIHERPSEGNLRRELGHWEVDTVVGKIGSACLLTLTDRKSRYLLADKVAAQRAEPVKDSMIYLLKGLPKTKRRSVTSDRGKEFSFHKDVTKKLEGLPFYFADPQSPWQRGTNENTSGLLREYFPKRQTLDEVTSQTLKEVLRKINMRPRKCLNWKTPFEVFFNRVLHLI